jgi:hypothetical protein
MVAFCSINELLANLDKRSASAVDITVPASLIDMERPADLMRPSFVQWKTLVGGEPPSKTRREIEIEKSPDTDRTPILSKRNRREDKLNRTVVIS